MSAEDFRVSKRELEQEIDQKSKDLEAFEKARDIIRLRVIEVRDSESKLTPLPQWSGTDAVLGSLDLAIHAMERTLAELKHMLSQSPEDPPLLRLVGDNE